MSTTGLAEFRKIFALIVTAAVVYGLMQFDMGIKDLPGLGFTLSGIVEPIVEFVILIGASAVAAMAQPNERGDTIWNYKRWLAWGAAAVVLLVVVVILIAYAMRPLVA